MNYKLEKFWNFCIISNGVLGVSMNYKLEKFWNKGVVMGKYNGHTMNYKLEKFWNKAYSPNLLSKNFHEL